MGVKTVRCHLRSFAPGLTLQSKVAAVASRRQRVGVLTGSQLGTPYLPHSSVMYSGVARNSQWEGKAKPTVWGQSQQPPEARAGRRAPAAQHWAIF